MTSLILFYIFNKFINNILIYLFINVKCWFKVLSRTQLRLLRNYHLLIVLRFAHLNYNTWTSLFSSCYNDNYHNYSYYNKATTSCCSNYHRQVVWFFNVCSNYIRGLGFILYIVSNRWVLWRLLCVICFCSRIFCWISIHSNVL